jgi:hypothetical protein
VLAHLVIIKLMAAVGNVDQSGWHEEAGFEMSGTIDA